MDLTAPLATATSSSNGKISKLAPAKRALFFSTCRRNQAWSLPDSIIYYIAKNPSSSKCYEKLIKSSKYFFVTKPLLVVENLSVVAGHDGLDVKFNGKPVDLKSILHPIWITNHLNMHTFQIHKYTSIFNPSKIYKSDIKEFSLSGQYIPFHAFVAFASKCEKIKLRSILVHCFVDRSVVTLDKIIAVLPNIKNFCYEFDYIPASEVITSDTVKEMIKIPHFSKLMYLNLNGLPDSFDIDSFYDYIKKNKKTYIQLRFGLISMEYKYHLRKILNEILQTENYDYMVPFINFPASGVYNKMYTLVRRMWKLD